MPFKVFAPKSYDKIKYMVKSYHSIFRMVSSYLSNQTSSPIKLVIQGEPIGYVLSNDDIDRIKSNISTLPGFANYLFMFGIDPENDNLTFCIVGADANGDVLPIYKTNPSTNGEEKWPTACKAKLSDASLESFLD